MRLRRALDEFVIDGIETTLPLFRALAREKRSSTGSITSTGSRNSSRAAAWSNNRGYAGTRCSADFTACASSRPMRAGA